MKTTSRLITYLLFLFGLTAFFAEPASCETLLASPLEFQAIDAPNDNGRSICLVWKAMPTDAEGTSYVIHSATEDGIFTEFKILSSISEYKSDYPEYFGYSEKNEDYHCLSVNLYDDDKDEVVPRTFRLSVTDGENEIFALGQVKGVPKGNWFAWNKLNNFILWIVLFSAIGYYIQRAKRNPNLFIRRIPGLEAVADAVGRATEMGKPLLYLTGTYEINNLSTIASVNILRSVSETVAKYDSRLINPHRRPITMTVCQEVVKEAYVKAGRPDAFREEDIYFITEDAFGFVAAADGIMMRERPAANFYFGTFAAESLLLAETGSATGAIQIAGTDSTYQIPFFIVACDYTLIGEELYAASAYLSREPKLLGSLRGQDCGKILFMLAIVLASLGALLYQFLPSWNWLLWLQHFFTKL